jgi:hypothetical protein
VIGLFRSFLQPAYSRAPVVLFILGSTLFFALLSFDAGGATRQFSLLVENEADGRVFVTLPVREGEEFRVEFLHSYDRFPFIEFYRVEGAGRIRLFKMVFRSMLNGQGFVYPGARVRSDGWGEIDGISSDSDRVVFIMGSREHADHRILLRDQCYVLSDIIEEGTIVVIRVEEKQHH